MWVTQCAQVGDVRVMPAQNEILSHFEDVEIKESALGSLHKIHT